MDALKEIIRRRLAQQEIQRRQESLPQEGQTADIVPIPLHDPSLLPNIEKLPGAVGESEQERLRRILRGE